MPNLLISLADGTQVPVDLLNEETFIGRLPENDIAIDDESLSGRHARFVLKDGTCELHDLQSTNGTFVNGTQIEGALLSHGDQVQFGSLLAEFQSFETAADSANPAPGVQSADEPAQLVGGNEPAAAPGPMQSRRPANFATISPLKRAPANNNSTIPLIAAGVIGFVAVAAAAYSILNIRIPD